MESLQLGSTVTINLLTEKRNLSPCTCCISKSSCLHKQLDIYQVESLTGQYTHKFKVKAGDAIFHNGDPIASIYSVRVGFLKVEFSLPNGQHQVTRFVGQGELFGVDGLADGKHHLDAYALTDGEVCGLNNARLHELMKRDDALNKALECAMSNELVRSQEHLFSLGTHTVEQKLGYFILEIFQKMGKHHSKPNYISLPMNREDLRSYLGMTTESLSRALTSLENKNFFKVKNREISNIDVEALTKLIDMAEINQNNIASGLSDQSYGNHQHPTFHQQLKLN
ncbi:Crp/Fnr family transcriptional regulator [Polynucleobacter kasalickyi]|uniref:Transcriptional regulator, Crp/Fnr family n=1 Tax=Polynucleobacter kasalickyi TaxID=1938817 RepID=A0A1W1Y3S6_9BURK|nr:Crp/Fnr family transcriptional regulator [Polynucleobacter kasalickyi]SMC30806.1 transcriptional regulator, Crp/Fnr family [Polynucleobacter kasalickyi]